MPFQPGKSGNSKGRPKNSGHRQKLFNDLVAPNREALISKALELALAGNEPMLKLFIERLLPPKPSSDSIELNLTNVDITKPSAVVRIGEEAVLALSNGLITPEQGKVILEAISSHQRNIEVNVLADRIAELEYILKLRERKKSNDKNL